MFGTRGLPHDEITPVLFQGETPMQHSFPIPNWSHYEHMSFVAKSSIVILGWLMICETIGGKPRINDDNGVRPSGADHTGGCRSWHHPSTSPVAMVWDKWGGTTSVYEHNPPPPISRLEQDGRKGWCDRGMTSVVLPHCIIHHKESAIGSYTRGANCLGPCNRLKKR
jgi:hypothetical protein